MQLNFKLRPEERLQFSLSRFFEGEWNKVPLAAACSFGVQGSQPMPTNSLVIVGDAGSGKSHLLKGIMAEHEPEAFFINGADVVQLPEQQMRLVLKSAAGEKMVLVDDLDAEGGGLAFYDELFHLFNELREKGGYFAATMCHSPAGSTQLPDYLYTRLLSGMVVEINSPGDDERRQILKKLAGDRQLMLADDGVEYILEYGQRSIASLVATLNRLEEKLDGKRERTLGRKLIKEVVEAAG